MENVCAVCQTLKIKVFARGVCSGPGYWAIATGLFSLAGAFFLTANIFNMSTVLPILHFGITSIVSNGCDQLRQPRSRQNVVRPWPMEIANF